MSNENIRIVLNERKLYLYRGDIRQKSFPIAVGKPATPSPTGEYEIFEKIVNPGGILGSRWMGFYKIDNFIYGIHGTNSPNLIGQAVSLGCIRMYNTDIESIFNIIPLGTRVTISSSSSGQDLNTYEVKAGDTLWKIAKQTGVDLSLLISLNNLKEPFIIYPGQKLIIPKL